MVLARMPIAKKPAGTLDTIEQTDGCSEGLEPPNLGPLQQTLFKLIEEFSSTLTPTSRRQHRNEGTAIRRNFDAYND